MQSKSDMKRFSVVEVVDNKTRIILLSSDNKELAISMLNSALNSSINARLINNEELKNAK